MDGSESFLLGVLFPRNLFARWVHPQEAYEMLVSALERGAELGECVEIIEAELAKKPLPGDVNKDYRKVKKEKCPLSNSMAAYE